MVQTLKRQVEIASASTSRTVRLVHFAIAGCLIYIVILSFLSIARHYRFQTQMNDLGNMTQAIHQAAQGNLSMPISNDRDGVIRSRFGMHANFIFLLLAPFFRIWPQPEALLVLSSICCGLAGLGIFSYARLHLGDKPYALLPALAFWISPIVHDANLFDFHVVTIAAMCVVWMMWAFDSGRSRLGWVLAVLAMFCKEDVPLMIFGIGFFYWADRATRQRGNVLMAVSAVWFLVTLLLVMPYFEGQGKLSTVIAARAGWLGNTVPEIAWNIVTRPVDVIRHCLDFNYSQLPVYLLLSGGILALRAWRLLAAVVPAVLLALLSGYPWMTRISGTFYWIAPIAVIMMACILSAKRDAHGRVVALHRRGVPRDTDLNPSLDAIPSPCEVQTGTGVRSAQIPGFLDSSEGPPLPGPLLPRSSGGEGANHAEVPGHVAASTATRSVLPTHRHTIPWQLTALFWMTVVASIVLSPLPYGIHSHFSWLGWNPDCLQTIHKIRKLVPPNATMSVQNNIGAHFAMRDDIAAYPRRAETAEYLLFHLALSKGPNPELFPSFGPAMLFQMQPERLIWTVHEIAESGLWQLILQENHFYLFKRRSDPGKGNITKPIIPTEISGLQEPWSRESTAWPRGLLAVCLAALVYRRIVTGHVLSSRFRSKVASC